MVFMGEAAHGEAVRAALEELKKTDRKTYDHIMKKYVEPKEPDKKNRWHIWCIQWCWFRDHV